MNTTKKYIAKTVSRAVDSGIDSVLDFLTETTGYSFIDPAEVAIMLMALKDLAENNSQIGAFVDHVVVNLISKRKSK